ncbi:MAG: sulfatase, partial [Planctomycetota bacterium]
MAFAGRAVAEERPNFLIIVADDATWWDFGFTGSPDAKTPHLDRLATESLQFTRMYSPASCCSPTRHALYTGLYPIRSGAYPNQTRVKDGTKSLFTHLKETGYRVALQGKKHVGPAGSFPYEDLGEVPQRAKAATRAFFKSAQADGTPWLLVYASNEPHIPWTRGDASRWSPDEVTVPPTMVDTPKTREELVKYHAEISALDDEVGDLLSLLDKSGQTERTVVIFLSEQGAQLGAAAKWSCWDAGVRAAALIRWPGQVQPGETDALASYIDVTPTVLEIAGLDPAAVDPGCPDAHGKALMDGRSLLGVLRGEKTVHRDVVFAEHTNVGIN